MSRLRSKSSVNSHQKGLLGETKAMSALVARGYGISLPIAAEAYDFIARSDTKIDTKIYWVQAKYCKSYVPPKKSTGYVRSRLKIRYKSWHRGGRGGVVKYKKVIDFTQVNLVTVFLPEVDQVCFFSQEMLKGQDELSININDEKSKNYYKKYTNPKWL